MWEGDGESAERLRNVFVLVKIICCNFGELITTIEVFFKDIRLNID